MKCSGELRYTGKRLDEYNQILIDPLTSMLGSAGLAGWLASDKEKNPATLRLEQLRETCESLQTIEEILTSQMSVLNWTLDDAVTPPVEQDIITPKSTAKDRSGAAFADEDSTCCWCCSSAPIPEPTPEKREEQRIGVKFIQRRGRSDRNVEHRHRRIQLFNPTTQNKNAPRKNGIWTDKVSRFSSNPSELSTSSLRRP